MTMIYAFGPFELDLAKAELRAEGQLRSLQPQIFALLAFLLEHRERLVSKEEIFENVWDGRIVTDSALASRVKSLRKLLGDDGRTQRYIRTVHGKGFRFVAAVRVEQDNVTTSAGIDDGQGDDERIATDAPRGEPGRRPTRISPVFERTQDKERCGPQIRTRPSHKQKRRAMPAARKNAFRISVSNLSGAYALCYVHPGIIAFVDIAEN